MNSAATLPLPSFTATEPRYYVIGGGNHWHVVDDLWSTKVAGVESRHGAEYIAAEMNAKEAQ